MQTWHEELAFDFSEAITNRFFTEQSLFFDIETTGFSPARSQLYLIGCATRKADVLCIDQFFAESADEEAAVLSAFLSLLAQFDTIITFNGSGFDIPYLKAKCSVYQIPAPFDTHPCLDLYKEVSRQKTLLGLASLKQKSVELFLGIDRTDVCSGGELIEVYHAYRRHPSADALALLRGHNYEDVLYMPKLLPLLSYGEILGGAFSVTSLSANEVRTFDGSLQKELIFTLAANYPVPKPLSYRFDDCYLAFRSNDMRLSVRLTDEELRFFFAQPNEYYYLPDEDCAILKTLATGVDRAHRRQATASNCYTRRHALFLPQYEELFTPAFRRNARDRQSYFVLSEAFTESPSLQEHYIRHLFAHRNDHKTRRKYSAKKPE